MPSTENANEGIDTVDATFHYRLGANVENLTLTGGADLQGYGNGRANALTGNSGANLLSGGAGADTMAGGDGNDVYYVDNIGDTVIENDGRRHRRGVATVTYTLTANVEAPGAAGQRRLARLRQQPRRMRSTAMPATTSWTAAPAPTL